MPLQPDAVREIVLDYALRTFWAAVVIILAMLVARGVRAGAMRSLSRKRANANATLLLGNLARAGVLALAILLVLAIYTQDAFGWILTSFSAVGIVVGLSLQDILKNFFAGVWILVERPFRIGDVIDVGGFSGEVREIAFRTTLLATSDGQEVIVPNGSLMTMPVVNHSRPDDKTSKQRTEA